MEPYLSFISLKQAQRLVPAPAAMFNCTPENCFQILNALVTMWLFGGGASTEPVSEIGPKSWRAEWSLSRKQFDELRAGKCIFFNDYMGIFFFKDKAIIK